MPVKKPPGRLAVFGQKMHPKSETTFREGAIHLNTLISKTKPKRPSKGMRKHNRKMKQEARKASIPGNDVSNKRKRPAQV